MTDDKRLSERAAIVRITSRTPKDEILPELLKAFYAMLHQMQANEVLQITFDFKPLGMIDR